MNGLIVGATQGIGLGFVRKLLLDESITKLFATYRDRARATELFALQDQHSDRIVCLQVDVTEEAQISAAVQQIQAQVDRLDCVINCVGVLHDATLSPEKSLRQIDGDRLLRYFQINSVGAILLAKHLLPLLSHRNRCVFATISAKVGSIGDNQLGGWYGYRASKTALNMLMKTASIEYRRKNPQAIVVVLHPGTTDTELSRPFQRNVPPEKLFSVDRTVEQLLTILSKLTEADSGEFFSWDGSRLPW
ncbi:SDR family NAD(P)-dependent oxidoreductase [Microcoleus sp. FACHB-1515]|uniref:SDR family NAD(P)-dependent oxidoreductase n=1 Tax=Cyanophyceae TaxID=3028117 RepID=UPI001689BEFA|nr:SDR family NAD(P)-dependent oxidoreductase [Microcoleus sp. FACHB-1515]MBD2088920.1 SDR family NAD(P)-dependent oxidoreductase [Microcoleus sp. FACHB-1515]